MAILFADMNCSGNFGRGHYEEQFCKIILIWASGSGDAVKRYFLSRALVAILFDKAESFRQSWQRAL